ncbi:MAG: hypothetical protein LBT79_04605, partial [Elusimicrobiota bacterium]|nr:hypothetical protein [Elusimicrobiota bacterium]
TNTLFVSVKRIFKQSQILNASFHTLRHTFASWLVIGGISLRTYQYKNYNDLRPSFKRTFKKFSRFIKS